VGKALLDLGASINLMPLSMLKKIGDIELQPTRMTLLLADRPVKHPRGIVQDLLIKVDKFYFPVDFEVMDIEEGVDVPLILGRPFMKTTRVIIDVDKGKLKVRVQDEEVNFNVFEAMKYPTESKDCLRIDTLEVVYSKARRNFSTTKPFEKAIMELEDSLIEEAITDWITELERNKTTNSSSESRIALSATKEDQLVQLELKQLPPHLKYIFLEEGKPVIISNKLSEEEEEKLIEVFQRNKQAIGWKLMDLKGINPPYCMHKILMEETYKIVAQPQRRLNPAMKEVVRKEVVKLLEARMIYPISYSSWVSPVQVVPKKAGITDVEMKGMH